MLAELIAVIVTLLVAPIAYVLLNRKYRHPKNNWPVGIIDGFGDSVLLPWFNAAAAHYGILALMLRDWAKLLIALLLGLMLTVLFVVWRKNWAVYDDWSRPRKGRFNAAGWYHAGFMFVQASVIFLALLHLYQNFWVWLPMLLFAAIVIARFLQLRMLRQV